MKKRSRFLVVLVCLMILSSTVAVSHMAIPDWVTPSVEADSTLHCYLNSDGIMYKDITDNPLGTVSIADGNSMIWTANEVALSDYTFQGGSWTIQITRSAGFTEDFSVEIGSWNGSIFTPAPAVVLSEGDSPPIRLFILFQTSSFTVSAGNWLALRVTNFAGGEELGIVTGGSSSYVTSPLFDPGFPIPTTIYVDENATGESDGSLWDDAFNTLQNALDVAVSGDEIWVAEGVYKPSVEVGGTGDRFKTFQMINGVAIYGGFDPSVGDDEWHERDWEKNETVLSGDLNGDDISGDFHITNRSDNCYHVFYHPDTLGLDTSAVIDGFTITGGYANRPGEYPLGGGMSNSNGNPTVINCTFSDNYSEGGGGMSNLNSSPIMRDCDFIGNNGGAGDGGGMQNRSSSPTITNCIFRENTAMAGSGMVNLNSSPIVRNCDFVGNNGSTGFDGGAMNNVSSSPTITNCIFRENTGMYGGMFNFNSSPTLTNCTFTDNSGYGAICNVYSSPSIANCILWGDNSEEIVNFDSLITVTYCDIDMKDPLASPYPGTGNINKNPLLTADLHLNPSSPCIDKGNNSAPNLPTTDFEGDPRIVNGIVDMGADEYIDFEPPATIPPWIYELTYNGQVNYLTEEVLGEEYVSDADCYKTAITYDSLPVRRDLTAFFESFPVTIQEPWYKWRGIIDKNLRKREVWVTAEVWGTTAYSLTTYDYGTSASHGAPFSLGETWSYDMIVDATPDVGDATYPFTATVANVLASVTVPAGTFDACYKVTHTSSMGAITEWWDSTGTFDHAPVMVVDEFNCLYPETMELYETQVSPPTNHPPTALASDISGQPDVMYPDTTYTVTARYSDDDGIDDLQLCYLQLRHPDRPTVKPITMMWNITENDFGPWDGEEGDDYFNYVTGIATVISPNEYEIAWTFEINGDWPEAQDGIDFGICAMDDQGSLPAGEWVYDDTNASFTEPRLVLTGPLTLNSEGYGIFKSGGESWCLQGDTLSAQFTVTNPTPTVIPILELVVGGRNPNGNVVDFSATGPTAINPGQSVTYTGTLEVPEMIGNYYLFCAYQKAAEDWISTIDVQLNGINVDDPHEADVYRTKQIEVIPEDHLRDLDEPSGAWQLIDGPWSEEDCSLSKIAVDPNDPNTLYAVVSHYHHYWGHVGDELYKSHDGGSSWAEVGAGLPRIGFLLPGNHIKPIGALAVAPSDSTVLYLGSAAGGVYKSTDGGINWRKTNGPYTEILLGLSRDYPAIESLSVDPIFPDTVYAGAFVRGIYVTYDGGDNWYNLGAPGVKGFNLLVHPHILETSGSAGAIYASGYSFETTGSLHYPIGVYRRVATGDTQWYKRELVIDETFPLPLTQLLTDIWVSSDDSTVYFSTNYNWVYRGEGGSWQNWELARGTGDNSLPDSGNSQLAASMLPCSIFANSDFPHIIYASTPGQGIWWSFNSGNDWFPLGLDHTGPTKIEADTDTTVLYTIGGLGSKLYKLDLSSEWVTVVRKLSPGELRVYDADGRMTGMIEGVSVQEIPGSGYDPETDSVVILGGVGPLSMEVVGTESGQYGLSVGWMGAGKAAKFTANEIMSDESSIHQYSIDWDLLTDNGKGVTLRIDSDGDGNFEQTIISDALLEPPTAEANGPYQANEGSPVILDAAGSYDNDGTIVLYEWDFDGDGVYEFDSTLPNVSHTWDDDYMGTATLRVKDDEGLTSTDETTVTILNVDPIVNTGPDNTINEGDTFSDSGSFTDPGTDEWTVIVDYGDGSGIQPLDLNPDKTFDLSHTYADNGTYDITVTVEDGDSGVGTDSLIVIVNNLPPVISEILGPVDPVPVNTEFNVSADFTDPGILDTHTAVWEWEDTITSPGTVTFADRTVTGKHTYTEAGVYTVTLTVQDDDGGIAISEYRYVVVYDPEGGFVTGGGWIYSEPGCYVPDETLEGKANFGFVSKYKKGQTTPTGNTEFQFKAGDLNFHSDSYDWLVIAGKKAMYKGIGTINKEGNYGFMISAIDEKLTSSTDVDLFRIKIWDKDNGDAVVYDNQMEDAEDAEPATAIGGGNIVIHKAK